MGIFDKKKDDQKPDFSDVQSGHSSTTTPSKPDFSDVQSGSSSSSDKQTLYVVKPGDSLSNIAKRHYGDANKWKRIFEANRDKIQDPDLIHPGQELKIPAA